MSDAKIESGEPSVEVRVEEFSLLVANMSRLLSGFGRMGPLRDAGITLGEWVTLATLVRSGAGAKNKNLGRTLGVPRERMVEIVNSLLRADLVAVKQSGQGEKISLITVTDAGKAKLESINASLKPLLSDALKGRSLQGARKQFRALGRLVSEDAPEKSVKKKARKAERKASATQSA